MNNSENGLQENYGKEVQETLSIELIDLNHTGSGDTRENQIVIVTAPYTLAHSIRRAYRHRDPHGIKDFEMQRTNKTEKGDKVYELYFGGSYGASTLLGAVGEAIYYSKEIGSEFDGQQ